MRGAVEKLVLACFLGILTVTLYGCGGSSKTVPPSPPPPPVALDLPTGHGLTPTGENPIEVAAGTTKRSGNLDITCPAGGAGCVVAVTDAGATYDATGGTPTVAAALDPINVAGVGDNHGLTGSDPTPIAAGMMMRIGNVVVSCPGETGDPACVVVGATYQATGAKPTVAVAYDPIDVAGAGSNHGLTGSDPITIAAGETERHGKVNITCPAGGAACVVVGATYDKRGGTPTVAAALDPINVAGVGDNHGLTGSDPTPIAAGMMRRIGNVVVSCPGETGDPACVVVGANYQATGAKPTVAVAHDPIDVAGVGSNHGLTGSDPVTIAAGETERHGKVNITCPAGGEACVVVGATYDARGGTPTVAAALEDLDLPPGHGLTGSDPITIDAGETERNGKVNITCPAGGEACVVAVTDDGATYEATGGTPTVAAALDPINVAGVGDNHGLTGSDRIEVAAGMMKRIGNVAVSCPAGGAACVVVGATYEATGATPTVAVAHDPIDVAGVGSNHGLTGSDPVTIAAGETERHGKVNITCPAGGAACVVVGATYDARGGTPTVAAALDPINVAGVGDNHGLTGSDRIEVAAGMMKRVGNVDVTCPGETGDPACVVVGATYEATGATPTVAVAHDPIDVAGVGDNHGLTGSDPVTIAAGETERHGNVNITCPAGGAACVVVGATYDARGGTPTVAVALEDLDLPPGHDVASSTMKAGAIIRDMRGVTLTCPAGGADCVVAVTADGATYEATGGTPTFTVNKMILAASSGPSGDSDGGHAAGVQKGMKPAATQDPVASDATRAISQSSVTDLSTTALANVNVAVERSGTGTDADITLKLTGRGFGSFTQSAAEEVSFVSNNAGNTTPALPRGDWSGSAFIYRPEAGGGTTVHAVAYSDIEESQMLKVSNFRVFTPSLRTILVADPDNDLGPRIEFTTAVALGNRRLGGDDDDAADLGGDVTIGGTTYNLRLATSESESFVKSHAMDDELKVELEVVDGVWVPGTVKCAVSACAGTRVTSPTIQEARVGGTWTVTLNDIEMVPVADRDYMTLGVWLSLPDNRLGEFHAGAFADGAPGDAVSSTERFIRSAPGAAPNSLDQLQGKANYSGSATGLYAENSKVGTFSATADLEADFGTQAVDTPGTLSGSISRFMENGSSLGDWKVLLEEASPTTAATSNDVLFDGDTGGEAEGRRLTGKWGAEFFGVERNDNDGNRRFVGTTTQVTNPTSVAGTFGASWQADDDDDDSAHLRIIGAFGANKVLPTPAP